jgi:hypothetical protein
MLNALDFTIVTWAEFLYIVLQWMKIILSIFKNLLSNWGVIYLQK